MPRERSNARPIGSPARTTTIALARTFALALFFAFFSEHKISAAAPSEYEVKAAFILNFARFVEWPSDAFRSPTSPLVIGVVGANDIAEVLPRVVANQTAQGRPIEVRPLEPTDDSSACQVLFIGRSVGDAAEGILKSARKRPVLTVGETDGFNTLGGIIRFLIIEKSVRFDVHAKTAADAGLKISSKLLSVARTVIKSP
ncbi:MAG: YfiR family protein [Verrucomicrobiales bacterium]|nr:YfiR family protein [Verrucomicrobiales bacterium]